MKECIQGYAIVLLVSAICCLFVCWWKLTREIAYLYVPWVLLIDIFFGFLLFGACGMAG